jgi:hypothetical protein
MQRKCHQYSVLRFCSTAARDRGDLRTELPKSIRLCLGIADYRVCAFGDGGNKVRWGKVDNAVVLHNGFIHRRKQRNAPQKTQNVPQMSLHIDCRSVWT